MTLLIPALILYEEEKSRAKSYTPSAVWTKSVNLSRLAGAPLLLSVSRKLKAPSKSLAAGGFVLAGNTQSSLLNHQKIIITGVELC